MNPHIQLFLLLFLLTNIVEAAQATVNSRGDKVFPLPSALRQISPDVLYVVEVTYKPYKIIDLFLSSKVVT